jgi:type II secretory pathway pseudopilin PulG
MSKRDRAGESGMMLVETLIVVGIVGFALVGLLDALSSGALGVKNLTSRTEAASLVVAQMESIKGQPYVTPPTTYAPLVTVPGGYSLTSEGQSVPGADANVQRVVLTVTRDGQTVSTLESLKVNRP